MPLVIVFFSALLTNFSVLADDEYYNVPEIASISGVSGAKIKALLVMQNTFYDSFL